MSSFFFASENDAMASAFVRVGYGVDDVVIALKKKKKEEKEKRNETSMSAAATVWRCFKTSAAH